MANCGDRPELCRWGPAINSIQSIRDAQSMTPLSRGVINSFSGLGRARQGCNIRGIRGLQWWCGVEMRCSFSPRGDHDHEH